MYLHNRWADFNEILTQYSWGLGCVRSSNVILATRGHHWHHDMMVAPPVLVVQGLGCVVSKFGEDLSSGSKVMAQNVYCLYLACLDHHYGILTEIGTYSQSLKVLCLLKILFHILCFPSISQTQRKVTKIQCCMASSLIEMKVHYILFS